MKRQVLDTVGTHFDGISWLLVKDILLHGIGSPRCIVTEMVFFRTTKKQFDGFIWQQLEEMRLHSYL